MFQSQIKKIENLQFWFTASAPTGQRHDDHLIEFEDFHDDRAPLIGSPGAMSPAGRRSPSGYMSPRSTGTMSPIFSPPTERYKPLKSLGSFL